MIVDVNEALDEEALMMAAKLMAAAARTAPKGRGVDRVTMALVSGQERENLAKAMEAKIKGKKNPLKGFSEDAECLRKSPVVLLVGVKGTVPKKPENPLNCGACGYGSCAEFIRAEKKKGEDFTGPLCVFESLDLGIALGSAVKQAASLNVDNRIMYTIGAAAKELKLLEADIVMGIPLSVSGKNIYFDR